MITPGILQGRLSPAPVGRPQAFPWATWRDEFAAAARIGFGAIEWLVTAERPHDNPIWSATGVAEIHRVAAANRVEVTSVCADCVIALPLVGAPAAERRERVDLLAHVMRQSALLDAQVIVVPLLEANAPANAAQFADVMCAIEAAWQLAEAGNVRVAIESDWPAARLRDAIGECHMPGVGVCYDIGNAVAFGLDAAADIPALGALVTAVHVKDRLRTGESVALGTGDADLAGAFAALAAIGYSGTAVLETPVGPHPLDSAAHNLRVVRALLPRGAAARS